MVNRFEDLAPLIAPQGLAQGSTVGFRQGVVESWNPNTAANTVRIGGTLFTNLPILASSPEVLTMQVGDVVGVQVVGSSRGGPVTMYIVGRITLPGTAEAASALKMFAIATADVGTPESTTSTTYTDLTTVGPQVTDVPIGPTGRCLVVVTAAISIGSASAGAHSALMSHAISGATTRNASDGRALHRYINNMAAGGQDAFTASQVTVQTGLNTGAHTFTAKYRIFVGGAATFSSRSLAVIPF